MNKSGFSMVELVFVIVILGVLAAVAIPRFSATRTEAGVASIRSDIGNILKTVPSRIFAENLDATENTPPEHSNWGEFIIDTAGLDKSRWQPFSRGVKLISSGNNVCETTTAGLVFIQVGTYLSNTVKANLIFDPSSIKKGALLCDKLKESYPTGSDRKIPLSANGGVVY